MIAKLLDITWFIQMRLYLLVSCLSTSIDFLVMYGLFILMPDINLYAQASLGYLSGLIVHFNLSRRYVFDVKTKPILRFFGFLVSNILGLSIRNITLFSLVYVGLFAKEQFIALNSCGIALSFISNFLCAKFLVFRRKK